LVNQHFSFAKLFTKAEAPYENKRLEIKKAC